MNEVSIFRLYVLRATYFLLVVGVGAMIWPLLLGAPEAAEHFRGVTWCLLGTVALLALLGLRYPLKMLPLLFFELVWKTTWLVTVGLPLRRSGQLEGAFRETWFANVMGLVIFLLAIPWGYVIRRYVREPGDRWGWSKPSTTGVAPERPLDPGGRHGGGDH
ncbi:MAG TPA: hypothetical protein VJM31_11285 [Vicinamibacterales bacterium]|nr:hypothetical protein [Vicinamibacterales bacterium]